MGVHKFVDARPKQPHLDLRNYKNNAKLDSTNKRSTKRAHKESLNDPKTLNVMAIIVKEIRINSS